MKHRVSSQTLRDSSGLPQFGYIIERRGVVQRPISSGFLAGGSQIRILCENPTQTADKTDKGEPAPSSPFRLRGTIDDLATPFGSKKFKSATPATISFVSNDELDKETAELDAVARFVISQTTEEAAEKFILFGHYKQSKTTVSGALTEEVKVASVGFLYDRFQLLNDPKILFNYELGIRPTATFDLAQDAKTFGFKAFLAPGLAIGKFILAQENDVFAGPAKGGWLLVYPDLRLVSEAMYASDAGSNVAIRDDDMYVGLGIQPILEFSLNVGNALDRLRLSANIVS
jgi:hypothetical protein